MKTTSLIPDYIVAQWDDKNPPPEDKVKWAKETPPPPIGTKIMVTMNKLGRATVTGYFVEHNWLGILCKLHNPPDWHKKQNPDPNHIAHIFALEFKLED
jgi:hypothetical protein